MAPLRKASRLACTILLFSGGWLGCASAVDVHAIQSPNAHFNRYRSVAFVSPPAPPKDYALSNRSADVRTHVEEDAEEVLKERGYVVAPLDHADLVVRIEAGRKEQKVPETTGSMPPGDGVAGGSGTLGEANATGLGGANVPGPAVIAPSYHGELDQEERDRVDGAFVIDVFEGDTRELVWHGAARRQIDDAPIDYDRLKRTVASVLASFPAAAAK